MQYLCLLLIMLPLNSAIKYQCGNSSSSLSNDWDYLTYAQQWPTSFCMSVSEECNIPPEVTSWTIHGLWPSAYSGNHPEFCYAPQYFDDSQIQSLIGRLNRTWANLKEENPYTYFWQHEWCKHGTCALNFTSLKGEMTYFTKGLDLHETIDIKSTLESDNVFPGKNYSLSNITDALTKKFMVKPNVLCFYDSGTHILQQIEICLSKSMSLIDCPGSTHLKNKLGYLSTCSSKHDLYYPPLKTPTLTMH